MPTLHLTLRPDGTSVSFQSDDAEPDDIGRIASRFPGSQRTSPLALQVPLDSFLQNPRALKAWPSNEVKWQPELQKLLRDSLRDAQRAKDGLEGDTGTQTKAIAPSEVDDLLGAGWLADLTWFQRRDIAKLASLSHGANFSVPGAGKTRVALADFYAKRAEGEVERLLVVAPKSAHSSWLWENQHCLAQPLRAAVVDGALMDPLAELLIVNYERLAGQEASLSKWLNARPSMVVLDEAHRMKRGSAGVYGRICMRMAPLAERRVALTGTPAPNGVQDLQNVFNFVWPGVGSRHVEQAIANRSLGEASTLLKPLFARTTKSELDLPPLKAEVVRVALQGRHKEIYSAIRGEESLRSATGHPGELERYGRSAMNLIMAATAPALLSSGNSRYDPLPYNAPMIEEPERQTLAQLLADLPRFEDSPKYEKAKEIVAANAVRGRKTIVWSTFIRSLTTLERMLGELSPALVYGGTTDRQEQIDRFRNDPACMVLLSNPATLGEGISLHDVCHEAVYVDRDYNAGRFLQSLDRIHRLGLDPETETNIRILVAENTIDEIIEVRLGDKLHFMGTVLDDPGVEQLADLDEYSDITAGLERSDLESLLAHLSRTQRP